MSSVAPVVDHLFEFVDTIDPRGRKWEDLSARASAKCRALKAEIDEALHRLPSDAVGMRIREALSAASRHLDEFACAIREQSGARQWRSIYGRLARTYEQLARSLASAPGYEAVPFRTLRRRNSVRNVFHVTSGVVAALTYHFLLERSEAIIVLTILACVAATLEVVRRRFASANDLLMRFPLFARCARPHEFHRVNSSTYYVFGLLVACIAFPKIAVEAAAVTLAVGDPVASNVGRLMGRHKLRTGKSLEGSLGFVCAGAVVVALYLMILYPVIGPRMAMTLGLAAGLGGAIVELMSTKLDDNLTIPAGTAFAVTVALALSSLS